MSLTTLEHLIAEARGLAFAAGSRSSSTNGAELVLEPLRVMQSIPDGPDANCMAACVASLFGLRITDVPHLPNDATWVDVLREWTAQRGYGFFVLDVPNETLWMSEYARGYQIVAGKSKRSRLHAVIYNDGALWHDPHPDSTGIEAVTQFDVFYPLCLRAALKRGATE